ncbi:ketopantoate reductase family protein, partial [Campylobacter jejuni]|nr:ketopantoate reductase family protein [Campylobacter jejuni]
ILSLGVIRINYGYFFSENRFIVKHLVRKEVLKKLEISLLDGIFPKISDEIKIHI